MTPCYQVSGKYFGREEDFPLCHICSGISEQIGSCLCQFPISSYINQTVLKTSKLSDLAFQLNFIQLSFCTLSCLLGVEEEESSPHQGKRYKECTRGKGDMRTQMPTTVTLEQSSAKPGLAVGFYIRCLLLSPTPPACPSGIPPCRSHDFSELCCEKQSWFFLITPVICQLLAETSPNKALPAAGSGPLFSSCFREEMDWSIYLSRASSIRERQAGFLSLLRLCCLLGSLPCSWSHLLPEQGR